MYGKEFKERNKNEKKKEQKVRRWIGIGSLEQVQRLQNKILMSVSVNKEEA